MELEKFFCPLMTNLFDFSQKYISTGSNTMRFVQINVLFVQKVFMHYTTLTDALKSDNTSSLNRERFLTDTELSEMPKLTKRTLLEYRNCGKIPYYQNRRENTLPEKWY